MRVPFIVKPPAGSDRGKRESSLISTVGIAATRLGGAEAEMPSEMPSQDLSHYLQSDEHLNDRELGYMGAGGLRAMRDDRWKFCQYQDRADGELYDLHNTPWKTTNLWDEPDQAQSVRGTFNASWLTL